MVTIQMKALGSTLIYNYVTEVVLHGLNCEVCLKPWFHIKALSSTSGDTTEVLICHAVQDVQNGLVLFFFSLGMVSISSLQTPEEKAESAGRDEFFWHCCKCFGPKQKRPHTGTGRSVSLTPSRSSKATYHSCGGWFCKQLLFGKIHEWKSYSHPLFLDLNKS